MARLSARPDLESLSLLVAVANLGSVGRAALAHGISQPSASARLRALERRLGLTVLTRRTAGSTLTAAGELVVGWAAPILAAAEEFSRSVDSLARTRAAQFTVAASLSIAEYLLPAWLVELHATYPDIAVRLRVANSTDVIAAVTAGTVPLGFVEGPGVPRSVASAVVGTDHLVLVVGVDHPWARRRGSVTAAELAATPLLLREPGSGTRQTLERALKRAAGGERGHGGTAALAPPALQLSTTTAIRTAAAGSTAPAVLSELTVAADIAAGRLIEVPTRGLDLRRRLRAVWQRALPLEGAAAALVRLARGAG
jgi:DNA-binding transcriptional LysR family regulator